MEKAPELLHIDLYEESLYKWIKSNKYIIFSELVRYAEQLVEKNMEFIQALMISNSYENIVFIIKRKNVDMLLNNAMEYFISIEEYEQCAKIRNLNILIQNLENETGNIKVSKSNQRGLKSN
jgi:hypothetical protein